MLYARSIWLRNCGRFTHVSSDFGSLYHTHIFATSEALYASLTRSETWRHETRFIELEADAQKSISEDYFFCDYDVAKKPVWFTPGLFTKDDRPIPKQRGVVDRNDFNVIDEGYPSTGVGRKFHCPTYGQIESVLPGHRMLTHVLSPSREELELFSTSQTFMLGKKRTMFQIDQLSEIIEGEWKSGVCKTDWLQFPPDFGNHFSQFEVLAATMRYIVLRGTTREALEYAVFRLPSSELCLPDFYLDRLPIDFSR